MQQNLMNLQKTAWLTCLLGGQLPKVSWGSSLACGKVITISVCVTFAVQYFCISPLPMHLISSFIPIPVFLHLILSVRPILNRFIRPILNRFIRPILFIHMILFYHQILFKAILCVLVAPHLPALGTF
jgi:hypothetical protein